MLPHLLHMSKFGIINNKVVTPVTEHTVVAAVHTDRMSVSLLLWFLAPFLRKARHLVLLIMFLCVAVDISSTMDQHTGEANPRTFIGPTNMAAPGGRATVREPGGIQRTADARVQMGALHRRAATSECANASLGYDNNGCGEPAPASVPRANFKLHKLAR